MRRSRCIPIAHVVLVLAAAPAIAGVVIEQTIESDGFGGRKIGKMTATSRTWIEGECGRTEVDASYASKWMNRFAGGPTAGITRLDKGLIWNLMLEKRKYTETTFEELRQAREQSMEALGGLFGEESAPEEEEEAVDVPAMEFGPPEIRVDRSGRRETIAGFDSEQVNMTITSTGTHGETGETCTIVWANEIWIADTGAEQAMRAYHEKLVEELGFDREQVRALGSTLLSALAKYGGGWERLEQEVAGLDGTPMRSITVMTVEGACGAGASGEARAEMPSVKESFKSSGKKLLGRLGGLGRKKDKQAEPEPEPEAAPVPAGPRQLFSIKTETTVFRIEDVGPDRCEIPAGFKKVKR